MSGIRPTGLPEWVQVGATAYIAERSGWGIRKTRITKITKTQVVTDTGDRFRVVPAGLIRVGDKGMFAARWLYRGDESDRIAQAVAELTRQADCTDLLIAARQWQDRTNRDRLGFLREIVEFADKYRHLLDDGKAGR